MQKSLVLNIVFLMLPLLVLAQSEQEAKDISVLVYQWANAETQRDSHAIAFLYADKVHFYGKDLSTEACMKNKSSFYNKYPDYKVEIVGDLTLHESDTKVVRVDFKKRVTYNHKVAEFDAYLSFNKAPKEWKIIEESDKTTDANLEKMKNKQEQSRLTVKGDFNGDGKQETATVITPEMKDEGIDCVGDCKITIRFSDRSIPDIVIDDCIDGSPVNHGDLNDNKTDEIGILPLRIAGCWNNYHVYTLINNKWEFLVKPFTTFCDQWEDGVIPIKKDLKHPGNVIISYTEYNPDKQNVVKTKSIPAVK